MRRSALALAAALVAVAGCTTSPAPDTSRALAADPFRLHTGPDGRVYRIDARTGKTSWLDGTSFRDVAEQGMPQLVVGRVYRAEDGVASYRYAGNGQLEKWGLDRYSSPSEKPKAQ